ncbi:MAG TPA: cyanophycinase [Vicinamibacterales bacterium]|nr:cyanophycinase [Vicinamibacterales bacterium]
MAKKQRRKRVARPSLAQDPPVPALHAAPEHASGTLVIIGGNENKKGHRPILEDVARRVGRGTLVIATLASELPHEQWRTYQRIFKALGIRKIVHLSADSRDDLLDPRQLRLVDGASVVFFSGGDQLKITRSLGGTAVCDRVRDLYAAGATIAGTSSGAAVMSETMMIDGTSEASNANDGSLRMAPGLGLLPGVVIDQHFAERGRIGRLLGAVAQNPRLLGLGIDEDTAVIFDGHRECRVMGSGAAYVVDARQQTYSNIQTETGTTTSIHGLIVHVLSDGDRFDLQSREPRPARRRRRPAADTP